MDNSQQGSAASVDQFTDSLYTVSEAARYLRVPVSTFAAWIHGYRRKPQERDEVKYQPVLTIVGAHNKKVPRGEPTIPFVGLAEGLVLAAIRQRGVSLQRIRPALKVLAKEMGLAHALASRRLYTDGAEVLFDYAKHEPDAQNAESVLKLVVVRNGQHVFSEAVESYLHRITYGQDDYAQIIRLPQYTKADCDVRRTLWHSPG